MATAERIIPLPSVPVVDIRSGLMDPTWYDYFLRNAQLFQALAGNLTALGLPAYAAGLRGFIGGLNMTRPAVQDITVAIGGATDSTANRQIVLATAITKQLANVWAPGTAAGGRLSTDALVDGTWNVHLIMNSATGDVDVLFALSTTPSPLPAGYDFYRRIGAVLRNTNVIRPFTQRDDYFYLTTPVENYDAGLPEGSRMLVTMTCPPNTFVMFRIAAFDFDDWVIILQSPTETDATPDFGTPPTGSLGASAGAGAMYGHFTLLTNSSSQIAMRSNVDPGSSMDGVAINTFGWIDTRQ